MDQLKKWHQRYGGVAAGAFGAKYRNIPPGHDWSQYGKPVYHQWSEPTATPSSNVGQNIRDQRISLTTSRAKYWGYNVVNKFAGRRLEQTFTPTFNPIRSNLGWDFENANTVMQRLERAHPNITRNTGWSQLREIVDDLYKKNYTPRMWAGGVSGGAGSVFPYIQMELGGEIIDVPVEARPGMAFSGMKFRAVRGYIDGDKAITFSERLRDKLAQVPAGLAPEMAGRRLREYTHGVMSHLAGTAMHGGHLITSRMMWYGQSYKFSESHEFSQTFRSINEQISRINRQQVSGDQVEVEFKQVQERLYRLYKDVNKAGYTVLGSKWEQMQGDEPGMARMIAMNQNFTVYQGLYAGNPAKGFGHLGQRELIRPEAMRGVGFSRVTPWIQPKGYASGEIFEVGLSTGILHPKLATRVLGESGFAFSSQKAISAFAQYPQTVPVTLQARIIGGEVERSFSKGVQDIFRQYDLDEYFKTNQVFQFDRPIRDTSVPGELQRLIGQSLGRSSDTHAAGVGDVGEWPRGMSLSQIKARRRGMHMEYEFLFEGSKDTLDMGKATGLLGTKRVSPVDFVPAGAADVLVRPHEMWGKAYGIGSKEFVSEVGQASLGGRWLHLAQRFGGEQMQRKVGAALGLRPGMRGDEVVWEAGNQWILTRNKVERVRKIFSKNEEMVRRGYTKDALQFFVSDNIVPDVELDALLQRRGITDPVEIAELKRINSTGKLIPVMESSPWAIRAGMAGLKQHQGMRYRLDQYVDMLTRASGADPELRSAYLGHAESIMKILRRASGETLNEAGQMFGPMLTGITPPAGAETLTLAEYRLRYGELPRIQGGVGIDAIKGTILDPDRPGFWLDVGDDARLYFGTDKELIEAGGGKSFVNARKIWMPSSKMLGIEADSAGMYFMSESGEKAISPQMAAMEVDDVIRSGDKVATARALGIKMSSLLAATRSTLLGKLGKATPSGLAYDATYSRLQQLTGRADDMFTLGITESGLRAKFNKKQADAIMRQMSTQEGFFVSAIRWPMKEPGNYIPAIKMRLVTEQELGSMSIRGARGNWDNVLFAGKAVVQYWRGDHDADTIAAHFILDSEAQKRMATMATKDQGYRQFLSAAAADWEAGLEQGADVHYNFRPKTTLALLEEEWAEKAARGTAELHKVKYGSPYPEVFMRARKNAAALVAMASGIESEAKDMLGNTFRAKDILRRSGLEVLESATITPRQLAAMNSLVGTWSQMFTGKVEAASFALIKGLHQSRGGKDINPIVSGLKTMVAEATKSGKFPQIAPGFKTMEEMIPEAAQALATLEPAFYGRKGTPTPFGAFYGVDEYKNIRAFASALGGEVAELETFADLAAAKEIARSRGIDQLMDSGAVQAEYNTAVKGATGGASHIQKRLFKNGVIGGLKNLWRSGWGGKAAIIGGGAIVLNGLMDGMTGTDEVMPAQAPLPPDIRMPPQQMAPQFAIPMPDTRVEHPRAQSFMSEGQVEGPYFDTEGLFQHISTNILDTRLAFGQISVQNTPMTNTEMEYLLRDKMRSDF